MRRVHGVAALGAVAAGAVALILTVTGQPAPAPPPPGTATTTAGSAPAVDGYLVGHVPAGVRSGGTDSTVTFAVTPDGIRNDGVPPAPDEPTAAVTARRYERDDGASWIWVTVLRPERVTAAADRSRITGWLLEQGLEGAPAAETFEVPAGAARLAGHLIAITTPDGVVITIGGNRAVPVADLGAMAAGITPA